MQDFLDQIQACVPALRRYARALSGNASYADDLVQDCLERALRKRALWRPHGPLRPWLFTIMINLHRNNIRRTRRHDETVPLDALSAEPAIRPNQPGALALVETARAIAALPLDQREVLLLVALEGFGYTEAAKLLKIPTGTLMSRLSRARASLRAAVDGDEPRLRTVR